MKNSGYFYFRPIHSRVPTRCTGAPSSWSVARNAVARAYGCNLAETAIDGKREAAHEWLGDSDIIQEGETVVTVRRCRFKPKRKLFAVCKSIADEEAEQSLPFLVMRKCHDRIRLPSSFADWVPPLPELPPPEPEEPLVIPVGFTAAELGLPESEPDKKSADTTSSTGVRRSARIAARATKRARA